MDGSEFVTSLAERLSWPGPAAGRSATTRTIERLREPNQEIGADRSWTTRLGGREGQSLLKLL
jgi:hypothetical protein